ncbi:Putative SOS response-associated peptidase YedK [Paenibacillus sp. UNCCL117]|uniref:SOS response-associated peptidase n=1 Tax=unclassified Paenibacillus TaxID=185978 RepID=UPI000887C5F3|nr:MULTISPECIES: SOS response-associated peptidase [unclassified Paenibacillus]SDC54259.1 Putative SOS response-associated peptidase YedK [Paenibacillus sp. cl123]SFW11077.1 Putative SOS response-associated peptidase YedK [Paenibacillus sp. UNCCL117]
MCDRFSLTTTVPDLCERFALHDTRVSLRPRHDYSPNRTVPVIVNDGGKRALEGHRWGLVPFWAKDAVLTDSAEIQDKREYRKLFAKHRCVFPCDKFYVYTQEGKRQQVYEAAAENGETLALAGFYEIWLDKQGGEFRTCTMMTTVSNRLLYAYTERMPAILKGNDWDEWLNEERNGEPDYLQSLLTPFPPELMRLRAALNEELAERSEAEEGGADGEESKPVRGVSLLLSSLRK